MTSSEKFVKILVAEKLEVEPFNPKTSTATTLRKWWVLGIMVGLTVEDVDISFIWHELLTHWLILFC